MNLTDTDRLVELAAAGDLSSLERLLYLHFDRLLLYIRSRMTTTSLGSAEAEDVWQMTMAQAFLRISTLEIQTEAGFLAWLRVIADNQITDALRHQGRQKRGGLQVRVRLDDETGRLWEDLWSHESTASRKFSREEALRALHVGLGHLPEDYRRALELHYFQGRTVSEVAQEMRRSTGAVRGLLDRARKQLRESLSRVADWLDSR